MHVYIFRGPGRIFAVSSDSTGANLPERFQPWSFFKESEMHVDEPHAGVDVNQCLADIEQFGYHVTDAHERITDRIDTYEPGVDL